MSVSSPVFVFLGFVKVENRKSNQTPNIDDQGPLHPQDPPDCRYPWDAQYAQNTLDTKATEDARDPQDPPSLSAP